MIFLRRVFISCSWLLSANHLAEALSPLFIPLSPASVLSRSQGRGWIQGLQAEASNPSATAEQALLSPSEQTVYEILEQIYSSRFAFRVVVVGNGAILESTAAFPVMKLNKSPLTGENLITMASEDQSFEYHLKTIQVSKIAFSQREANGKTLRIIRFLKEATPISSLILADNSNQAAEWYEQMQTKYGAELQLV